jgi:uncharacterized integral membrane protein
MIELATRVPVQLTPQQSVLVLGLVVGLMVAVVVGILFESILGGVSSLVLRLTGHRPPRRSSFRTRLDELEERLRQK